MGNAAIINPYWDTLGGGERYVSSFSKLLLDIGWQVDIQWPVNLAPQLLSRFGLDLSSARFINQVNPSRYKLLFWVSDGSLPLSLAAKTLVHMQFPFTGVNGSSLPNFLKSRFYTFVCSSHFTKSFIDPEFSVASSVIYPPVDTTRFTTGPKTKTIIYVGRFSHLTQQKNPHILISAFKAISPQLPGWKLIIAGGAGVGTESNLLDHLKVLGKNLPISFLVNPTIDQLQKLYSEASIFWSASGYGVDEQSSPTQVEHFGITPVEAMSAGGVPLLVNLGGHKEIIDPGTNGFLWNTPQELEKLTVDLCHHPKHLSLLSTAAREKSKIFSIASFNSQFTNLIK